MITVVVAILIKLDKRIKIKISRRRVIKTSNLPGIYRVPLHLALTFHLDAQVLVCPFLQPIGLVDYRSLKKSICRVRLFSSRFLKQFMDWASTSSCDNLFHLMMTLWEKKYKRESQWQLLLHQFPRVPSGWSVFGLFKKCDQGVEDNPFISLNNSIKSALLLLSSRDHSPNWRNLVSYGNGLRWGKIRVKRCCILSSRNLSLL